MGTRAATLLLVLLYLQYSVLSARPNVLIFLADDLGYGDLNYLSANNTRQVANSQHIDALARNGARINQAYAAEGVCTPSRSAMLTGRYPIRSGMASSDPDFRTMMSPAQKTGLPHVEYTLAEALRDQGYKTVLLGKWHLGIGGNNEFLPTDHGFDYYYGMPVSNVETCGGQKIYKEDYLVVFAFSRTANVWIAMLIIVACARFFGLIGNKLTIATLIVIGCMMGMFAYFVGNYTLCAPLSCVLYRDKQIVEQPVILQNLTLRFTHEAIDFLDQYPKDSEKPFFLMMSYIKVHTALFTSSLFEGKSKAGEFGDNVEEMDWSVGKIMDALETNGFLNNTIVFFTSDNGPYLERGIHAGDSGYVIDPNGEQVYLKGGKGQNWEGGIRVPTIVYWKDYISSKDVQQPLSLMDFYPTILSLAGHPGVTDRAIDGRDISKVLFANEGETVEQVHEYLYHWCGRVIHAVRHNEWKMHWITPIWDEGENHCDSVVICQCVGRNMRYHAEPLLFNITADPGENHPLPTDTALYKEILTNLTKAKEAHERSIKPVPNQLESLPRPWLMPCCNKNISSCRCVEQNNEYEHLLSELDTLPNASWRQ